MSTTQQNLWNQEYKAPQLTKNLDHSNPHISIRSAHIQERYFNNFAQKETSKSTVGDNLFSNVQEEKETKNQLVQLNRRIPKQPYKLLDALDWSSGDQIAVALGNSVYLWNAGTVKVNKLLQTSNNSLSSNDMVTGVSWSSQGVHLAVGMKSGAVEMWDCAVGKRVRQYPCQPRPNISESAINGCHFLRVGTMDWNGSLLTTGSRDHIIYNRDVRSSNSFASSWPSNERRTVGHRQEVCGLRWATNEKIMASGGNDNRLLIWNLGYDQPIWNISDHNAAVKAMGWNPHASNILASGGGTADRCIKFWDCHTGENLYSVDTGSQVCNIAWSKSTYEMVSTHGYSLNQIIVWEYPSMKRVATLTGHTYRVLYLASSPDGDTIVTGAGDETIRFWNIFPQNGTGPESVYTAENATRSQFRFNRSNVNI